MKVIKRTPLVVFHDLEGKTMWLGVALATDPITGRRRRIWGLVEGVGGTHLTQMNYEARTSNPLTGDRPDRWVFHAGAKVWAWTKDVKAAAHLLALDVPETYLGVDVPLKWWNGSWRSLEADAWREGVRSALIANLDNLRTAAIHNLDESTVGLVRELTSNLTREAEEARP